MFRAIPDIRWGNVSAIYTDVDETLINDKSMRSYLTVYADMTQQIATDTTWAEVARVGRKSGRDAANATYYRNFAGQKPDTFMAAGHEWFRRYDNPPYWITPMMIVCQEATTNKIPIILVSGSHHACMDHIASRINAAEVICTELVIDTEGRLTGERSATAIGSAKAHRVLEHSTHNGIHLTHAIGAGDHSSDNDFITRCGSAIAVGTGTSLTSELQTHGYRPVGRGHGWTHLTKVPR